MSNAKGFSLLEALIASALLLLLMALMLQIVIPISKGSVRGSQQVELQQVAVLAVERLRHDLEAAPPAGITAGANDRYSFHRLVDVAADGSQIMATDLVVVWWERAERRLLRKVWPPAPPVLSWTPPSNGLFVPTPEEFTQLVTAVGPNQRVLASNVEDFSLRLQGSQVLLRLQLQAPAPDGRPPEGYELNRVVALPNAQY